MSNKKEIDIEKFKELYYEEKYSTDELCDHFGVSKYKITTIFKENHLKYRDDHYKNKGPSMPEAKKKVTSNFPDPEEKLWQLSQKGRLALSRSMSMQQTKHGLYASIPIICKEKNCPYKEQCYLLEDELAPKGDPCPIEIANLKKLMQLYSEELDVDTSNPADQSLLRDLVDIDISLLRINKKLSIDANIIQHVVVGVSEDGNAFTKPEVHKAYDLQNRLAKRKIKILNELNATPKRKEKIGQSQNKAADLMDLLNEKMQKLKEKEKQEKNNTIDITKKEKEGD